MLPDDERDAVNQGTLNAGGGDSGRGIFSAPIMRGRLPPSTTSVSSRCARRTCRWPKLSPQSNDGKPYDDWRAMLDDKSVDAVAITAPHHLHCQLAMAALQAGKHVLLEKADGFVGRRMQPYHRRPPRPAAAN